MEKSKALDLISKEYDSACKKFPKFNSYHEGYAVLKEEVDELWDQIKKKDHRDPLLEMEAVQVGAMALKFLVSLINE